MKETVELLRWLAERWPSPNPVFTHTISHGNLHRGVLLVNVWITKDKMKTAYLSPDDLDKGHQHIKTRIEEQMRHGRDRDRT